MKKIISIIILVLILVLTYLYTDRTEKVVIETVTVDNNEAAEITIVAFGDSLTAGFGLNLNDAYPAQLEAALKEEGFSIEIINSGVSGETTAGNLSRAEFIRKQNPDFVLLGIGGNDALRFISIEETKTNLEATLETLLSGEEAPEVVLLKMQAPANAGGEYKTEFDQMYDDLAERFNLDTVPFIVEEVALNPELIQADGIHPNRTGYAVLVQNYLLPKMIAILSTEN